MIPTHCPNCGAAITEENNGKFCLYCGGKLPEREPVQNITNNYDNRVENHYHTTVIQQVAPTVQQIPEEKSLPSGERVKENPRDKIIAVVIGILLIVFSIASKQSLFAYLAIVFITFAIVKRRRSNYCPKCFFHKEFNDTKCPHCGKTVDSQLARIIAALCADTMIIFIANAVAVSPK